jgi:hypothetical protein
MKFFHFFLEIFFSLFFFFFSSVLWLVNHEYRVYKSYSGTNFIFHVVESTGILHQNTLSLTKHVNLMKNFHFFLFFGHLWVNKKSYNFDIRVVQIKKTKKIFFWKKWKNFIKVTVLQLVPILIYVRFIQPIYSTLISPDQCSSAVV